MAVLLMAVLHFFPDDAEAAAIVRRLLEPLPPGSFLAISHGTYDFPSPTLDRALELYAQSGIESKVRDKDGFTAFFQGLELQEPGVVPVSLWRRPLSAGAAPPPEAVNLYGALARKR